LNEPAPKQTSSLGAIAAIVIVVGYVGLELSTLHTQRYRTEPLFIFDEFVTADHAAQRCGEPDAEERERFQSNFQVVRRKALAELQEAKPQATAAELTSRLDSLAAERTGEVDAFIDSNGCEHTDVWRWVKLHEVRARLNLR
jgi:hypothetical protein